MIISLFQNVFPGAQLLREGEERLTGVRVITSQLLWLVSAGLDSA
jgi:hypothetical protein